MSRLKSHFQNGGIYGKSARLVHLSFRDYPTVALKVFSNRELGAIESLISRHENLEFDRLQVTTSFPSALLPYPKDAEIGGSKRLLTHFKGLTAVTDPLVFYETVLSL